MHEPIWRGRSSHDFVISSGFFYAFHCTRILIILWPVCAWVLDYNRETIPRAESAFIGSCTKTGTHCVI